MERNFMNSVEKRLIELVDTMEEADRSLPQAIQKFEQVLLGEYRNDQYKNPEELLLGFGRLACLMNDFIPMGGDQKFTTKAMRAYQTMIRREKAGKCKDCGRRKGGGPFGTCLKCQTIRK